MMLAPKPTAVGGGGTNFEEVNYAPRVHKMPLRQISEQLDRMEAKLVKIDKIDLVEATLNSFIQHQVPNFATKLELEKRPTRRQAIFDIAWVVGLISACLTIGSKLAH
jgi:hypothetical protein